MFIEFQTLPYHRVYRLNRCEIKEPCADAPDGITWDASCNCPAVKAYKFKMGSDELKRVLVSLHTLAINKPEIKIDINSISVIQYPYRVLRT